MDIQINFSTKNLHSGSDLVKVVQTDNCRVNDYSLSLEDLVKILGSATSGNREQSPFLPKNCFKYIKGSNRYEVFVEIPKQKWMINFNGNMFEVGFPRLIFVYECQKLNQDNRKNFSVSISRIVAVKGKDHITGDTPMYSFPYSHVEQNGRVCMGGNRLKEIDCLSELGAMHNIFFHSPFFIGLWGKNKIRKIST